MTLSGQLRPIYLSMPANTTEQTQHWQLLWTENPSYIAQRWNTWPRSNICYQYNKWLGGTDGSIALAMHFQYKTVNTKPMYFHLYNWIQTDQKNSIFLLKRLPQ